jgi:hypothetical protein
MNQVLDLCDEGAIQRTMCSKFGASQQQKKLSSNQSDKL